MAEIIRPKARKKRRRLEMVFLRTRKLNVLVPIFFLMFTLLHSHVVLTKIVRFSLQGVIRSSKSNTIPLVHDFSQLLDIDLKLYIAI